VHAIGPKIVCSLTWSLTRANVIGLAVIVFLYAWLALNPRKFRVQFDVKPARNSDVVLSATGYLPSCVC